jgi:hypothetical protein
VAVPASTPETDMSNDPFHEGERRVQQRVGEVQEADRNSPTIAAHIPAGAIPFLRQQSLLILAGPQRGRDVEPSRRGQSRMDVCNS